MISSTFGRAMLKWFHHFSMAPQNLAGQHAVVTGAAQGIGFAVAERLHSAGAAVALLDLDAGMLARAVEELVACGDGDGALLPLVADVADSAQVEAAIGAAVDQF